MQIRRRHTVSRRQRSLLWVARRARGELVAAAALGAVLTFVWLSAGRQVILHNINHQPASSSIIENNPLYGDRLVLPQVRSLPTNSLLRSSTPTTTYDSIAPKVAWLMSFPNSGTSFTLRYVRRATNTSTATNYGMEVKVDQHDSIPIHSSLSTNGPWVHWNPNRPTKGLPSKYVLTKTHCSGYCSVCTDPDRFLETPRSFRVSCQQGSKAVYDKETEEFSKLNGMYDAAIVKKAIHMFRHPLDNIVARFHLLYHREANNPESTFTTDFPNTAEGFHAWCKAHDEETSRKSDHPWLSKMIEGISLDNFDCHQEFLQYVQWHNNAFATIRELDIPTLVMFYEDYSKNLDLAGERILTFLEADIGSEDDDDESSDEAEFTSGKTYLDFYTDTQKSAIKQFLFELSSPDTWEYLRQYF